ncbi:MAG: (S)-ureidoglycine aminohydrolase [Verrucomicrobiia bacterium]
MQNPLDSTAAFPLFGGTRTRVAARHALLTPDGFVPSFRDGAVQATIIDHINPALGASFVQYSVRFLPGGKLPLPAQPSLQRVLFIVSGNLHVGDEPLRTGNFLYLPPGTGAQLHAEAEAEITVFEKIYQPHPDLPPPTRLVGHTADIPGVPFLGNPRALLQTLLPDRPEFDLAVNLFTYQPGATLPFVETHIMEHGLLMTSGQGVYRLEDSWYPVKQGDIIWMAPYCPQWFVAMGDTPASYLYYKNINRLPSSHA